jgi:hypothetical protein
MADDIHIRIGLEGDAEIKRKLDQVRDTSKKSGDEISKALNQSISTGPALGRAIDVEQGLERSRVVAERFREAVHTLHPVLDEAGLGFGNLGAFARVAGVGLSGLAAAIAGSILVALAKMGDEAIIAKKRLGDLLQNPTAGNNLFDNLKQQAHDLKTSVSNLLPSTESLIELRNRQNNRPNERYAPGSVPSESGTLSNEKLLAAQKTAFEGLKAGGATADEAGKGVAEFYSELAKTGQLSATMVENLAKIAPGFANTLAQSLQRGLGSSTQLLDELAKGTKINAEEIIQYLVRIGPAVHEALVNAPRDSKTFSVALDEAKASAGELLDVLKGPNVSIPLLENLSKTLQQDKTDLEAIIGLWKKLLELLENSPLGWLTAKIASATGAAKKPNERVSEGFGQLSGSADEKKAEQPAGASAFGGLGSNLAAASSAVPTSGRIIPQFNDDGTVNPYGGQPNNRPNPYDDYTHPFAQAPTNEAERQQQQRESAAIGKKEGEYQKIFNQNIRDQNGGNNPSLDKSTYAPPTLGHYDPQSQSFIADRKQPARDPSQVPGAPQPTTFPAYQERLTKEFQGSGNTVTVPGDPAGIKIRPIEDQRSDAGQSYQAIASAIAGSLRDAFLADLTRTRPADGLYAAGGGSIGPPSDQSLRVRPESSRRIAEFSEHEAD